MANFENHVTNDYSDMQLLAIGFVNTSKYLFSPDCSFEICEKPSKFSKSVQVVFAVSALSLTAPTPCPRSQRLRQHFVRVVNDYADTVSE